MAQWYRIRLTMPETKPCGFNPWVGKIPWKRTWEPTPVFLPEKCYGQRSLIDYSSWGHRVRHTWALMYITFKELLLCSVYKFFVGYVNCKYFLPVCYLSFIFFEVFQRKRIFDFVEIQYINILRTIIWMLHLRTVRLTQCHKDFLLYIPLML